MRSEPPVFLKKIGDCDVYDGMSAKFTACATGYPEPEVEWFKNDQRLFPSDRIDIEKESNGLLRLSIKNVNEYDVGRYSCRIYNPYGDDICHADLFYDGKSNCKYVGVSPFSNSCFFFKQLLTLINVHWASSIATSSNTRKPVLHHRCPKVLLYRV